MSAPTPDPVVESAEARGADAEKGRIVHWLLTADHVVKLDDATCRWLANQITLNRHRETR